MMVCGLLESKSKLRRCNVDFKSYSNPWQIGG
jgi:hypothetical protein